MWRVALAKNTAETDKIDIKMVEDKNFPEEGTEEPISNGVDSPVEPMNGHHELLHGENDSHSVSSDSGHVSASSTPDLVSANGERTASPVLGGSGNVTVTSSTENGEEKVDGGEESDLNFGTEVTYTVKISAPGSESFTLQVSSAELIQEIHQVLLDREDTCHRSCFSLQLDGHNQPLDKFTELKNVEGIRDGAELRVVEEAYTVREARVHIRHVRDLLRSMDPSDGYNGLECVSPSFLSEVITNSSSGKRVSVEKASVDCTPPDHVMPGSKERPLTALMPQSKEQANLQCLKQLNQSGWNPPPGNRKLHGDLMYLYIITLEDKQYHITCCTKGFFVNQSTNDGFNPKPDKQKLLYHSLVELLNHLSPSFKKNFAQIQKWRCQRHIFERLPTPYQIYPWIAPQMNHSYDSVRGEDATQSYKLGFEDHIPGQIRDWNEELMTTRELPRKALPERLIRERAIFKIHSDFVSAAMKGAMAVVDGNVVAINPGDETKMQMFLWNNIFFSLGFDVKDHYKEFGGDAAAFSAPNNDLQGVKAYFNVDQEGLFTLGTVIIDYKGFRVTAQSIIPGILEREQEQSVVYGSIDFGKTVVTSEKYMSLMEKPAQALKILPHSVLNEDGTEVKLCSSVESKGIVGNDGRYYILDLLRTFPPDVNFLPDADVTDLCRNNGFPREFPHKLVCLRQELVDAFTEERYLMFIKVAAFHLQKLRFMKMIQPHASSEQSEEERVDESRLKEISLSSSSAMDTLDLETPSTPGTPVIHLVGNPSTPGTPVIHLVGNSSNQNRGGESPGSVFEHRNQSETSGCSSMESTDILHELEASTSVLGNGNLSLIQETPQGIEKGKAARSEDGDETVDRKKLRVIDSHSVSVDSSTGTVSVEQPTGDRIAKEVKQKIEKRQKQGSPDNEELPEAEEAKKIMERARKKGTEETTDEEKGDASSSDSETKEVIRKAALAVGSLSQTEFDIRFNPDLYWPSVKHAESEELEGQKNLVRDAAHFLLVNQIPQFVKDSLDHSVTQVDGIGLTEAMHTRGINIRYLGKILQCIEDYAQLHYLKVISMCELVCRSTKHVLRKYLQGVEPASLAAAVAHFLSCLLGSCPTSVPCVSGDELSARKKKKKRSGRSSPSIAESEWGNLTPKLLWQQLNEEAEKYYGYQMDCDTPDAFCEKYDVQKLAILRRLCQICGIQIVLKEYYMDSKTKAPFSDEDIVNLFPIVKHISPRATDAFNFYQTGQAKIQQGQLRAGYELINESLNLLNNVYGAMHPEIAQCLRLVARLAYILGDHQEALNQQHKALLMSERCCGVDHPQTILEYMHLALYCFANLQISTALKLLYRARYLLMMVHGENHPQMALIDSNIGLILHAVQEYELSMKFLEHALQLHILYYGRGSLKTALTYHLIARAQSFRGDFRTALQYEKETFTIYKNLFGEDHEKTKESSECLKHLTQQAVSFQKKMNQISRAPNASNASISQLLPLQIQQSSLQSVLEVLNVVNGIVFIQISPQEIEALRAELEKSEQSKVVQSA